MRTYFKVATGCLLVALASGPAAAQNSKNDVQAPRSGRNTNQTDMKNPDTTKTPDTSQSTPSQDGTMQNKQDGTMQSKKGASGNAQVRQAQETLKSQGQDPGPVDGMMGPQTKQALREYQKAQNLKVTGRLDSETSEKLGVSSQR